MNSQTLNTPQGAPYKCLNCGVISYFKQKDIIRCKTCTKLLFTKCRDPKKPTIHIAI